LNTLYLSTIETLAMAIDAKDQITHGHIRRVQAYAVGLAKRLGVGDENLIKAIEAAALLHDTGKLAIPEYILNKPGKLTPVEFEKMKQHASLGADILSAIKFPYPVVPIVRHHHENWDGTGYPAGLKGTSIPIGARILSVVDCFDALTSDRPYRPRLSDEAAMNILKERRGSMYDPLVVDVFGKVHEEIAPSAVINGPSAEVLSEITTGTQIAAIKLSSNEKGELERAPNSYSFQSTGNGNTTAHQAEVITTLQDLIQFSLAVVFVNDPSTNELRPMSAVGEAAGFVEEIRIPLGERLSGWVAVNRQTITNSDASLDLGGLAELAGLRFCLSTPLFANHQFVGVISLYSASVDGFSEADRTALEIVSQAAPFPTHSIGSLRT
jgi:putative nucleotidyltransferase with HDIG domain